MSDTPRSAPEPPDAEPPRREPGAEVEASDGRHPSPLSPLSTITRMLLLIVGWVLILVGVAGLVLPGIQGILTIVAGAAVLSLASELAYRMMRHTLGPWPGVLSRVERLREKVHAWLSRD